LETEAKVDHIRKSFSVIAITIRRGFALSRNALQSRRKVIPFDSYRSVNNESDIDQFIDGQARLVSFIRFQMDTFRLFLR
jgi:hypothetical protein